MRGRVKRREMKKKRERYIERERGGGWGGVEREIATSRQHDGNSPRAREIDRDRQRQRERETDKGRKRQTETETERHKDIINSHIWFRGSG